jgi:hypothetical protein
VEAQQPFYTWPVSTSLEVNKTFDILNNLFSTSSYAGNQAPLAPHDCKSSYGNVAAKPTLWSTPSFMMMFHCVNVLPAGYQYHQREGQDTRTAMASTVAAPKTPPPPAHQVERAAGELIYDSGMSVRQVCVA